LLWDKARADLVAATEELGQIEIDEPSGALPRLGVMLAPAEGSERHCVRCWLRWSSTFCQCGLALASTGW